MTIRVKSVYGVCAGCRLMLLIDNVISVAQLQVMVPAAFSALKPQLLKVRPPMHALHHSCQSIDPVTFPVSRTHQGSQQTNKLEKQHTPGAKCAMCQVPCVHTSLTIIYQCVIAVVYLGMYNEATRALPHIIQRGQ